jgi:hypothetical protein
MLNHKALIQEEFEANTHIVNLAQAMTNLGDEIMYSKGTTKIDNISGRDGFAVTVQLSKEVAIKKVVPAAIVSATENQLITIVEQALEELVVLAINSKDEKRKLTSIINKINKHMDRVTRIQPTSFQPKLSLKEVKDNF